MSEIAPRLLKKLGADVVVTHAAPNGTNINDGCGAVHVDALRTAMRAASADFGVAYDGDGDRSMFMLRNGRLIDGDGILLIMARRLKKNGKLDPPAVIGTSMTNFRASPPEPHLKQYQLRVALNRCRFGRPPSA